MINRYSSRGRRLMPALVAAGILLGTAGCSLDDLVKSEPPPTSIDPELFKTEEGALALYRGAIWAFRRGFAGNGGYNVSAGHMTDELTVGAYAKTTDAIRVAGSNTYQELETRAMNEDGVHRSLTDNWYRDLNRGRNQAMDGIYYLSNFAPFVPKDLVGHLYAIRGYSMVLLAEAFCSGIPLTDYKSPGGMDYKPGSTSEEVYTKAIAQFDTALANMPDSVRYRYLATVGKARALANLGKLNDAAQLVKGVPDDFIYQALFADDQSGSVSHNFVGQVYDNIDPGTSGMGTVADSKGINGLPYVSANDPRIPLVKHPLKSSMYPNTTYWLPAKYLPNRAPWNGLGTRAGKNGEHVTLASGIEARLIEAEAAAAVGDASFLMILNHLRTDGTSTTRPNPADTTQTEVVWNAGSGGVAGLAPLADPGDTKARIKMVFDERAYWTFLTGQRQGALRRMVRVHGFDQDEVYPTGPFYWGGEFGPYTNIPVPANEGKINKLYKGCFNRDA